MCAAGAASRAPSARPRLLLEITANEVAQPHEILVVVRFTEIACRAQAPCVSRSVGAFEEETMMMETCPQTGLSRSRRSSVCPLTLGRLRSSKTMSGQGTSWALIRSMYASIRSPFCGWIQFVFKLSDPVPKRSDLCIRRIHPAATCRLFYMCWLNYGSGGSGHLRAALP